MARFSDRAIAVGSAEWEAALMDWSAIGNCVVAVNAIACGIGIICILVRWHREVYPRLWKRH